MNAPSINANYKSMATSGPISLRDKEDAGTGLKYQSAGDKNIVTRSNILIINSNDFICDLSLKNAQQNALNQAFSVSTATGTPVVTIKTGITGTYSGIVTGTTGLGVSPITITFTTNDSTGSPFVGIIQNGDTVIVTGVTGNTAANGSFIAQGVTSTTFQLRGTIGNGNYTGGGIFVKPADPAYPRILPSSNVITGNVMTTKLTTPLKVIRELSLINASIPRNIIPITTYIPDLLTMSLYSSESSLTGGNDYTSYIVQNKEFLVSQLQGFFSTPLSVFRTYFGIFKLPDQATPNPLALWNPPLGAWPSQPIPYPYQTVPTYQSNYFNIGFPPTYDNTTTTLTLSGLGVYDLIDWSVNVSNPLIGQIITQSMRTALLLAITPHTQAVTIGDTIFNYVSLVLSSNVVTPGNFVFPFGYGDYQRFVPGPGLGQYYQPSSTDFADPTVVRADSPIPFPQFRGNVWGPYDCPGDRFQKMGLFTLVQDLFLNGDLMNLKGQPIVINDTIPNFFSAYLTYGINFIIDEINWDNLSTTTNLNILNAQRIIPNGFGTSNIRATGNGATSTVTYLQGGGQGPAINGPPNSWVPNGVNGTSTFAYPIATGPLSGDSKPQTVGATVTTIGTGTQPQYRNAWSDTGPNNGQFIIGMNNFLGYLVDSVPDTNLVLTVSQSERTLRSQCTNSGNQAAIFNVPMRLSLGSATGTQKYQECLQCLLGEQSYWKHRFVNPLARLSELDISFTTYEGIPIPLEKTLEPRPIILYAQYFNDALGLSPIVDTLFSPAIKLILTSSLNPELALNPTMKGKFKKEIQLFFNIQTYEYDNVGLLVLVNGLLGRESDKRDVGGDEEFVVRSYNYTDYSN